MGVLLVQYGGDPVTLVTLCHYASGHKKNYVKEHKKKKGGLIYQIIKTQ